MKLLALPLSTICYHNDGITFDHPFVRKPLMFSINTLMSSHINQQHIGYYVILVGGFKHVLVSLLLIHGWLVD